MALSSSSPLSWSPGSIAWDVWLAGHASPAGLQQRRLSRWAALCTAARQRSAFYRERLQGLGPVPVLGDVPPAGKAELMARFDAWVGDARLTLPALRAFLADPGAIGQPFLGSFQVWESSGSTGEPAVFVQDTQAMTVYDALEAQRRPSLRPWRRLWDPCGWTERFAFVGATSGHFASTVSVQRLCAQYPWAAPRLRGFSFLQPMAELVAALNDYAPTILATYPSTAVQLAQERAAGRLRISPQEVWTGGEALSPAQRTWLQQRFGCPVSNSYGASECLALAAQCDAGALHLNSDWAILEPVDRQGRPVPDGELGHTTLLTNLANHVQPVIRYDLGDRVRVHPGRCSCGSTLPVIEVQGRIDDVLWLTAGDGQARAVSPLALTTVLEEDAGIHDFQLVQQGPRSLRLDLGTHDVREAGAVALAHACAVLHDYLRSQGLASVRVRGRCGVALHAGHSGKLARVLAQHAAGAGCANPAA